MKTCNEYPKNRISEESVFWIFMLYHLILMAMCQNKDQWSLGLLGPFLLNVLCEHNTRQMAQNWSYLTFH